MTGAVLPRAPAAGPGWRWRHVLEAPHRLCFFAATLVLLASAGWWAALLLQRAAGAPLALAMPASLVHAAVMTFGFIPLFFAGFLFTAGPRWLAVPPPTTRLLAPAVAAQMGGWLLWLAGSHLHPALAACGLALAAGGLVRVTVRFGAMTLASGAADRSHAKVIAAALAFGCACLAGLTAAVLAGHYALARLFVLSGLWGCVVAVYLAAAHRMIPFFTSEAVPVGRGWHPAWMLAPALGVAAFEVAAVWVEGFAAGGAAWAFARGAVELAGGLAVMVLAFWWQRAQRLSARLLAMLHLGFLWLGLALLLGGASQGWGAATGAAPPLAPAALHALTMGCLASLMLAMVTRVTCGHSGRPVVADNLVWRLFWLLQAATLLRIAADIPDAPAAGLLAAAAALWAAVTIPWGLRHGAWYGRAHGPGRR